MVETPATMYMDAATGPAGAFAVLAALHYRAAVGRGQLIELAQIENVLNQLGDAFVEVQLGGEPKRTGNRDPERAPQGVYPCRGRGALAGDQRARRRRVGRPRAAAIGREDLLARRRFADRGRPVRAPRRARPSHHRRGRPAQDVMAAFHTLQRRGVTAGPQFDEEMLASDPHVAARGWIRPLASRDVGSYPHIGYAFQGVPQALGARRARSSARTTTTCTASVLGLDDEEYQRLVEAKVIVEDYLDPDMNPV